VDRLRRTLLRATRLAIIGMAGATGVQGTHAIPGNNAALDASASGMHFATLYGHAAHPLSGFTWAIADTGGGTSCDGTPDQLDVFTPSGTLNQAFNTDAFQCTGTWGSNTVAIAKSKKQTCVLLADINDGRGPGHLDSFSFNPNTGLIGAEVSHLADPKNGTPQDVAANATGTAAVWVDQSASPTYILETSVGKGCALGKAKVSKGTTGHYNNAVWNGKYALAANSGTCTVDTYKGVKLVHSTPTDICGVGISALGTEIAVGSGSNKVESGSFAYPGVNWGGTASETGPGGANILDTGLASGCLFGGDEDTGYVSWFTTAGNPPAPAYVGDERNPSGSSFEGPFASAGSIEFMDSFGGGEIYYSTIGTQCALTLTPFATLSDTRGSSNGFVLY